jgi:hypothetical protein
VNPEAQTINVYRSMTGVREFGMTEEVPGDDVLPGFSMPVAQVFGG